MLALDSSKPCRSTCQPVPLRLWGIGWKSHGPLSVTGWRRWGGWLGGCLSSHHRCAAFQPILHVRVEGRKCTFPASCCYAAWAFTLPFDRCHGPTTCCHFTAPVTDHTKELPVVSVKHYLERKKKCLLEFLGEKVFNFYPACFFHLVALIPVNSERLIKAFWLSNLTLACFLCNTANDVTWVDR